MMKTNGWQNGPWVLGDGGASEGGKFEEVLVYPLVVEIDNRWQY